MREWYEGLFPLRSQFHTGESANFGAVPFLSLLFAALLFLQNSATSQIKPIRRILILNEVGTSYPGINMIDQGIRRGLENAPYHIEFYKEYLDTALFPDPAEQQKFRDFYINKYKNHQPDVIITVGSSPLTFMKETHRVAFPGVPIIFCVPNLDSPVVPELDSDFTGVENDMRPAETLEAALRLQPGTEHVIVLGGTGAFDRQGEDVVRKRLEPYQARLDISYLTDLSMPDLLEHLKHLQNHTVVLFTSISRDAAGTQFISGSQAAPMVVAAANAPVFALYDVYLNHGEVGGDLSSLSEQGEIAARMALRTLRGEKPENIPRAKDVTAYIFDWQALKRWGFKEENLPRGSIVLNREPTVWESYKRYIIGSISLIAIETLLILALMWQRARRRKAEKELGITYDRLRMAIEAGRFVGWDLDIKRTKNRWFGNLEAMFGISSEEYFAQTGEFFSRVHPDDRDAVARAIDSARDNRQSYTAEFRVTPNNGDVRWVIAKGKFYYGSNGEPERMLGLAVDVTEHYRTQELLRESEGRFRLVANTAPVMIWMAGPDTLFTYFNNPWLDLTGRSLEVELGNGWADSVHPEDSNICLQTYSEAFNRHEPFNMTYRLRRKDGEYRWVFNIGVPRFDSGRSFLGYIGSCIDITERKLAEEALSTVSRRLVQAQEQERIRIARELHDDINQRLALAQVDIEGLCVNSPDSLAELKERLERVKGRLSDISSEVQAISHRLHSSKLEYLGLVAASKSFCREMAGRQKISIEFQADGIPREVPQDVSLTLFRVLQESLQNVTKHSSAQHVDVHLRGISGEVQLTVRDDGNGFDVDAALETHGLGLISMRERVSLVKGAIVIESKPIGGTQITVRVPIPATDAVRQATSGAA